MINYIAKSDGTDLFEHSNLVSEISEKYIYKVYSNTSKNFLNLSKITGLLHDILKTKLSFQEYCKGNLKFEQQKFYHNELGWAFLKKYLNSDFVGKHIDMSMNKEFAKKLLCDAIFYHHGNNNFKINKPKIDDILSELSEEDIKNAKEFGRLILSDNNAFLEEDQAYYENVEVPSFFEFKFKTTKGPIYTDLLLIYDILLASDRLASIYKSNYNIDTIIDNIINKKNNVIINEETIKNGGYNKERYIKQLEIVNCATKTTNIKAPAGYGKSLIGLIGGLQTNKKIVWVCPTISTTKSVFSVIKNTINDLKLDISIEVSYGNELRESTHNLDEYESDIIIINIDTYLSSPYKQNNYIRNIIINHAYVIFDEYHEYKMGSPLFPLFLCLLNHRDYYAKEKTLLISATPLDIDYLLRNIKDYSILPSREKHFDSLTDKNYKVKFINSIDEIENLENTILFLGSLKIVQNEFDKTNTSNNIIHSQYLEIEKLGKIDEIIENHSKINKTNPIEYYYSTSTAQSSLDISFKNCVIAVDSPEMFMQGIGRCNRRGEYNDSTIYILKYNNNDYYKSHMKFIEYVHNKDIYNIFYRFLENNLNINKVYNINELYEIYNNFNIKYSDVIKREQNNLISNVIDYCKLINIKKIIKSDSNKIYASSNILRYNGTNEKFYIVKDENGKYIKECFNQKLYSNSLKDQFKLTPNGRYFKDQYNIMKELTDSDNYSFDYTEILKLIDRKKITNSTDLFNYVGNNNTIPFIFINNEKHSKMECIYSNAYGLRKITHK